MADTASFVVQLKDMFSGPARKSSRELENLRKQMGLYVDAQGRIRQANGRFATDAQRAASGLNAQGSSMRSLTALVKTAAVAWVAYKAATLGAAGAMSLLDRTVKTEGTIFTLDQLTHGMGKQSFGEISEMAQKFGLDIDDTAKSYANFLKLQFDPEQAKNMIRLGADMQALGNTADDVQGIFRAMGQIKSKDKLQAEEILQLAERGVSGKLIRENVAKLMGIAFDEVESAQRQGKVSGDIGLQAIEMALNQKLNQSKAGESGEKFVEMTMAGAMAAAKQRAKGLWITLAQEASPGIKSGLKGILDVVNEFSKSEDGARVVEFLAESMRKLGEFAEKVGPALAEVGTEFITGFVQGFQDGSESMDELFGPDGLSSAENWAAFLRDNLIPKVREFAQDLGQIASAAATVADKVTMVMEALSPSMEQSGENAGNGFLNGFKRVPIYGEMIRLAQLMHGAFAGPKGIDEGSPSKLFEHSGDMSGQGYLRGVKKSMPTGSDLAPVMSSSALANGASRLGSSAATGSNFSMGDVRIEVSSTADPHEVASATLAAFESNMGRMMSRFASEAAA